MGGLLFRGFNLKEYEGKVELICGPKIISVSIKIHKNFYPRYVILNNFIPNDSISCERWLEKNVLGNIVYFYPNRTNRLGQFIADVECNGFDVAQELIKQGFGE